MSDRRWVVFGGSQNLCDENGRGIQFELMTSLEAARTRAESRAKFPENVGKEIFVAEVVGSFKPAGHTWTVIDRGEN